MFYRLLLEFFENEDIIMWCVDRYSKGHFNDENSDHEC